MRQKKLKLSIMLLLAFGLSGLQAQESINTSGGEAGTAGVSGTVSYSVGQMVYTTNESNGTVFQGVQQPYEISVTVGIKETAINLSVSAYPNPTTDYLILKVDLSDRFNMESMSYQLFDISGKLLQNQKIVGNETRIDMSNLLPANYIVKVVEGNKELKTFKIIRN